MWGIAVPVGGRVEVGGAISVGGWGVDMGLWGREVREERFLSFYVYNALTRTVFKSFLSICA